GHDHGPCGCHGDRQASALSSKGIWPVLTGQAAYAMEKMAHGFQRKGRASGGGFYDYDEDDPSDRELWSGLSTFVRRSVNIPAQDIRDRLRFIALREVIDAISTRVAPATTTMDMVTVASDLWNTQAQRPLDMLAGMGAEAVAERAAALAASYGQRFSLPEGWQELLNI
ncbi:MAG: hypothetical protein Q4B13_06370, partial [Lautropia sp.]|nr:hypothetical protein [Lautropia sp.]